MLAVRIIAVCVSCLLRRQPHVIVPYFSSQQSSQKSTGCELIVQGYIVDVRVHLEVGSVRTRVMVGVSVFLLERPAVSDKFHDAAVGDMIACCQSEGVDVGFGQHLVALVDVSFCTEMYQSAPGGTAVAGVIGAFGGIYRYSGQYAGRNSVIVFVFETMCV